MLAGIPDINVTAATFDLDALREALRTAGRAEPIDEVASTTDLDAGGVPVRLLRPAPGAPLLVYLHGGGFCVGDIVTYDAFGRHLARRSGWATAVVDYRLAPEHPFPAGLDDARVAASWLIDHAAELGVDPNTVAVMGDSAGANLATGVARALRNRLCLQVLAYPCLDPSGRYPSYRRESGALTATTMDWYWSAYLPHPGQFDNPDAAPLLADDLEGLPRTLIMTAGHDPLRDEGERYAELLAEAGVRVTCTRYLGMPHGFLRRHAILDGARSAVDQTLAALRQAAEPASIKGRAADPA